MESLNRVELIGILADDPELRFTDSRRSVLSFLVNDEEDSKNTYPVVVWGELAEICNKRLRKGSLVHVLGKLAIFDRTTITTTIVLSQKEAEIFGCSETQEDIDKYSVQIVATKVKRLGNQSRSTSTGEDSEQIDTLEDVIYDLRMMSLGPSIDHKTVNWFLDRLSSIVLENQNY